VFDWNRTPERTLHIDRSLEVLDFEATELKAVTSVPLDRHGAELLAECAHFRTERITLEQGEQINGSLRGESYEIWGSLSGSVTITGAGERVDLEAVGWTLLPAALGSYTLVASQASTVLRILTPDLG
jgi:mannose-6-phosphate isomerase class I